MVPKKKIKIKFVNFWYGFDPRNNSIIHILNKTYNIELSEDPDYLFYSDFGNDVLNYRCIRIYFTWENFCPDFNICDYGIGYEYLILNDRYLRMPFYIILDQYKEDLNKALRKHIFEKEKIKLQKSDFCSFIFSNRNEEGFRNKLFTELSKYKQVNSGGRIFNNIGHRIDNKVKFELTHKFSIACENSSHPGYTTEKIMQAFAAQTIPIYWGNPTVNKDYNEKAFINCHNFESLTEIILKIKEIDKNDDLYYSMLSEPAFSDGFSVDTLKKDFENFLIHIFDQEYKQAYRRNRTTRSYLYEKRLIRTKRIDYFVSIVTFRKLRQSVYLLNRYGFGKKKIKF